MAAPRNRGGGSSQGGEEEGDARGEQHVEKQEGHEQQRRPGQARSAGQGHGGQEDGQGEQELGEDEEDAGDRQRQRTRGNRSPSFQRMLSIGFAIGHIVDKIDDTGKRAENREALNRRENRSRGSLDKQ